jgi:GNAT superfamily N-acetyltransferase
VVSDDIRRYAEDPAAWPALEFPPEEGYDRVLTDRYCALFGPVPSFTTINRLRLDPDEVAETLAEVRALVGERGHREAAWWVGSSATPGDLADRLLAHGLRPADDPGWEPHATAMVLVDEPPLATTGIEARRVETFDEFALANRIAGDAFGAPDEERAEWERVAQERWAAEQAGHGPRTFLAYDGGEPVGVGRAFVDPAAPAVLVIGGSVLERARGRGVYRALVRARWRDAVDRGATALFTQANHLSRPILERVGFERLGTIRLLVDRL